LEFTSAFPRERLVTLHQRVGTALDLRQGWNGRIGVTGRVTVTGQSQLITDISEHPDYIVYADETQSELTVPMKIRDEVIGVINIEHPELAAFDEEDRRVLEALAAQAAIAIENARLFEEVQKRAGQFKMLYESSLSLTAELSIEVVLQAVVNHARQLTGAQYGALGVVDANGAVQLFFTSGLETDGAAPLVPPSMAHGLLGGLLHTSETIRIGNIHEHAGFRGYPAAHPAITSFLGAPVRYQGLVIGSLYMANKRATAEFSGDDEEVLELLAAQAAVAIHNARQFNQIKQATQRLTAIHQISSAATKQEAQGQILQIAIREMVRVFEADRGGVVLFDTLKGYAYRNMAYPENDDAGEPIPLDDNPSIIWLLENRRPLAIEDARNDPLLARVQPIVMRLGIKSMLLAPLIVKGEVVGSIGLDATERQRQFTAEEQALLQTMVNHVALAIENAQLHIEILERLEELQRTRESLAARTAVAWMGMVDATWRHAIVNNALAIRTNIDTLRITLPEEALTPRTNDILTEIQRVVDMIRERPITPPLSREEGAVSVQINDFLRERLRQIQENERYRLVKLDFLTQMDERVTVRINREWIRNVFDILIDNAIEAMNQSDDRCVTLITRQVGQQVEIEVIDTGRGIPAPIRSQLGYDKIPKAQGERGMGMGVLLAQMIIQTYGGKIEVGTTGKTGTTIIIRLPVELSVESTI
jgi:GAF domain-containing protein